LHFSEQNNFLTGSFYAHTAKKINALLPLVLTSTIDGNPFKVFYNSKTGIHSMAPFLYSTMSSFSKDRTIVTIKQRLQIRHYSENFSKFFHQS